MRSDSRHHRRIRAGTRAASSPPHHAKKRDMARERAGMSEDEGVAILTISVDGTERGCHRAEVSRGRAPGENRHRLLEVAGQAHHRLAEKTNIIAH